MLRRFWRGRRLSFSSCLGKICLAWFSVMTKNPQGEVDSWAMDADAALPVSDYDRSVHSNPDAGGRRCASGMAPGGSRAVEETEGRGSRPDLPDDKHEA